MIDKKIKGFIIVPLLIFAILSVIIINDISFEVIEEEINYWLIIDNNFNKFLERGFLIGHLRGFFIIRTMENTLDDIIQIEENMINL